MIFRAKAPLRISFGGGGTDISPYPEERGGAVLNATIDKYAYCSLAARDDESVNVTSLDYDVVASYSLKEKLEKKISRAHTIKRKLSSLGLSTAWNMINRIVMI